MSVRWVHMVSDVILWRPVRVIHVKTAEGVKHYHKLLSDVNANMDSPVKDVR